MHLVFPRSQPTLQRGAEKNCQSCGKKFSTVMAKEHQCKRCLKAVCSDCGSYKSFTFNSNSIEKQLHRLCKSCKDSSDYINSLIKNNNLRFGEMSDIGKDWLKRIIKKPPTYGTDTSQHKIFTKQVFLQLWASYSFQLRELVGLLTSEYEQSSIYDLVLNVYKTVISAAQGTTLAKIMHLIIYALCFCSSDKATLLVLYLLQLKRQHKDIKAIAFKFVKALPYLGEYQKIENYLHYRFDKYIDSLFVNGSSIECSVFFIGETLKKKNLEDLLMFFSSHVYINRQTLYHRAVESSRDLIDLMVLRYCSLLEILPNFKQIKNKNIPLYNEENNFGQKLKKTQNLRKSVAESDRNEFQEIDASFESIGASKPNFAKRQVPKQINNALEDSVFLHTQDQKESQMMKPRKSDGHKMLLDELNLSTEIDLKKTVSQNNNQQKFNNQSIHDFRKNSFCSRCEYFQQESEKLKRYSLQSQLERTQLKNTIRLLEAEVVKLQKDIHQFDNKMVQLVNEKSSLQKVLQQTKKQLKQAMKISVSSFGDSELAKKKFGQVEKQLLNEIYVQKDLNSLIQKKDTLINQQKLTLELNDRTIKNLTNQNEALKQDIYTLDNLSTVLKKQKSQLQIKITQKTSYLISLEEQLNKNIKENNNLKQISHQLSASILKAEEVNKGLNERIRIMQQKMVYYSQSNAKLTSQMDQLIIGWNEKEAKNKQEVRILKNRENQLQMTIFSLNQQIKLFSSQSKDVDMKESLEQTRKEYEQKMQKQIQSNHQLQTKISRLQTAANQKEQQVTELYKQISALRKIVQQKQQNRQQLLIKITEFQQEQIQAKIGLNNINNRYEALKKEIVRLEQQLGSAKVEISSLKPDVLQKNDQLQRKSREIEQYINLISALKSEIATKTKAETLLRMHQQSINEEKDKNQRQVNREIQQRQQEIKRLKNLNAQSMKQIGQMTKNNKYFNERCEQLEKQLQKQSKELQKLTLKTVTTQQQLRHVKVQLQKTQIENKELVNSLKLAQQLLSEKQDEIRALGHSTSKSNQIAEKIVFEKLKEVETNNQTLKNDMKESQKQRKGLIGKMDQLSTLMMQLEGEKLELAEQNFYLKQVLENHKIDF